MRSTSLYDLFRLVVGVSSNKQSGGMRGYGSPGRQKVTLWFHETKLLQILYRAQLWLKDELITCWRSGTTKWMGKLWNVTKSSGTFHRVMVSRWEYLNWVRKGRPQKAMVLNFGKHRILRKKDITTWPQERFIQPLSMNTFLFKLLVIFKSGLNKTRVSCEKWTGISLNMSCICLLISWWCCVYRAPSSALWGLQESARLAWVAP